MRRLFRTAPRLPPPFPEEPRRFPGLQVLIAPDRVPNVQFSSQGVQQDAAEGRIPKSLGLLQRELTGGLADLDERFASLK